MLFAAEGFVVVVEDPVGLVVVPLVVEVDVVFVVVRLARFAAAT